MKSAIEYKLRCVKSALAEGEFVDVYLRGDSKPFRLTKLVSIQPYAVEAVCNSRAIVFDPADVMAVMMPQDKPLASA